MSRPAARYTQISGTIAGERVGTTTSRQRVRYPQLAVNSRRRTVSDPKAPSALLTMAQYRCYFLDRDGHIRERADIEADTLRVVIDRAHESLKKRPQCRSFEVWQGDQRLYPEPYEKA